MTLAKQDVTSMCVPLGFYEGVRQHLVVDQGLFVAYLQPKETK